MDFAVSPSRRRWQARAAVRRRAGAFVSAETKNQLLANEFLVNYLGDRGGAGRALRRRVAALPRTPRSRPRSSPTRSSVASVPSVPTGGPMPNIPEMGEVWAFWGVTEAAIIQGDGDPAELVG